MGEEQVGTGVIAGGSARRSVSDDGRKAEKKWMSILVASINVLDVEARIWLCLC